jgi:hypothetical protein
VTKVTLFNLQSTVKSKTVGKIKEKKMQSRLSRKIRAAIFSLFLLGIKAAVLAADISVSQPAVAGEDITVTVTDAESSDKFRLTSREKGTVEYTLDANGQVVLKLEKGSYIASLADETGKVKRVKVIAVGPKS